VWRSNAQLELAIVEWVAWFNTRRLHSSIGYRPPIGHEADWRAALASESTSPTPPTGQLTLNASPAYEPFGLVSAAQI
jgi:hypothetical protein